MTYDHQNPNDGLVVSTGELRGHLNLGEGHTGTYILRQKILAATAHVESHLGFTLDTFEDGIPEPVLEAIRQLAAHFYENREPLLIGQGIDAQTLPFGISDLLSRYKTWVF